MHNNRKLETTQIFVKEEKDKLIMLIPYSLMS